MRSVTPGQQVIKIVHDNLVELLGTEAEPLNLNVTPPAIIMMLGLQGSGKTTTAAKLAKFLTAKQNKKVLLASLDVQRPAAQEQLAVLGQQINVETLPVIAGQQPVDIARRALNIARREGFDVVILDTAGRLAIDDELMAEAAAVRDAAMPNESLLVVDAMTGQDAVNTAQNFEAKIGVTGIILTRIDGDARGGAALSMRAVTGKPIKFLGAGEKIDALEIYHPDRLAGRILGMGDVVSLVEKAAATINMEDAEAMTEKFFAGGNFDFNDLAKQMQQMRRMGGMGSLMNLMPGMGKLKDQLKNVNIGDKVIKRQEAIIQSMTPTERKNADLLQASRKRRIAAGAGVDVADVNRLIKQFLEMQKVMKQVQKLGKTGFMRSMMPHLGGKFKGQ
jgi:signal recognition particle subunit SRP54